MAKQVGSTEVTQFLEQLDHPLKPEIEALRKIVLEANSGLSEGVKWNAPSYTYNGEDRITMRIHPPKQVQLIFHRGAKVQQEPKDRLIADDSGILSWKTNDRAVATFKSMETIQSKKTALTEIINKWLKASVS